MKRLSDAEAQKILKKDTYAKALMNKFLLYAFWILVGKALSKAYAYKIDVVNVITAPEIEMLIIHNEGAYERFKRSGKKPSEFCKMDLRMGNVKAYDFVKDYFANPKILVDAIREYRRVANIPKGEYSLADLLK